jgi:hypothetical protein
MRPGHVANAHTRMPPSLMVPLPARSGVFLDTLSGAGPPLSLEKMMSVLSRRPFSSSAAVICPMGHFPQIAVV